MYTIHGLIWTNNVQLNTNRGLNRQRVYLWLFMLI